MREDVPSERAPGQSFRAWTLALAGLICIGAAMGVFLTGDVANVGKTVAAVGALGQAVVAYKSEESKARAERDRAEAQAEAARSRKDLEIAIDDMMAPLVKNLRLLTESKADDRRQLISGFMSTAMACSRALIVAERVRVTIYQANGDRLVPGPTQGRGDQPRSIFTKGTVEGDHVWTAAEREETRFCRDVQAEPPPGWDATRPRDYRTFMTVPICSTRGVEGLLTLNAPNPDDLTENDKGVVQVIAGMLGVAFGLPGGRPQLDEA